MREALFQLEAEGLVRMVPQKGAIVSELSLDEINDVFDLRLILEPRLPAQSEPRHSHFLKSGAVRHLGMWQGLAALKRRLQLTVTGVQVRNVVGNKTGCGIVVRDAADVASIELTQHEGIKP